MISVPNFSGIIGLWLLLQVVTSVISSLVMIYVLFCLGKTASALDRMAAAIEELANRQTSTTLPQSRGMSGMPSASFTPPTAPYTPATPPYYPASESAPIPFTPGAPSGTPSAPPSVVPHTPTPPTPGTPPNATGTSTSEGEFSSGSNVPYIPRREMRP